MYDFDGDTTVPVVERLAAIRPWLHLLRNDLGCGVVNAIRAGFRAVGSGPALVIMADLADDLTIVPEMLRLYAAGYRIVCPSPLHAGRTPVRQAAGEAALEPRRGTLAPLARRPPDPRRRPTTSASTTRRS